MSQCSIYIVSSIYQYEDPGQRYWWVVDSLSLVIMKTRGSWGPRVSSVDISVSI